MFFTHPKCYVKLNRSFKCDNGPLDTPTGKLGGKCKMQNQCQTFVSEAICCFKNVSNFRKKTHVVFTSPLIWWSTNRVPSVWDTGLLRLSLLGLRMSGSCWQSQWSFPFCERLCARVNKPGLGSGVVVFFSFYISKLGVEVFTESWAKNTSLCTVINNSYCLCDWPVWISDRAHTHHKPICGETRGPSCQWVQTVNITWGSWGLTLLWVLVLYIYAAVKIHYRHGKPAYCIPHCFTHRPLGQISSTKVRHFDMTLKPLAIKPQIYFSNTVFARCMLLCDLSL